MLEAIVQPYKLDEVHNALLESGFRGFTVTDVGGYGRQKGHPGIYRGNEYNVDFIPKVKIELVCRDDEIENAVSTIIISAKTGEHGDGKIFIYSIEEAIRVRTEEIGEAAL